MYKRQLRDVPRASSEEMITKTGYQKRITPQSEIGQKLILLEKEKFYYRKRKDEEATNPNDEDLGFFSSLIPHVKKLQPRDKLLF